MPIVPTPGNSPKSTGPLMLPPNKCYIGGQSSDRLRSKLFVFVDFGASANSFLSACGTKLEPTVEDIALTMLKDPQHFLFLVEGWDK